MFTINHDHSYIRDEPNIRLVNNADQAVISDEDDVGSPATNTIFSNEDTFDPLTTNRTINENVCTEDGNPRNLTVGNTGAPMELYIGKGGPSLIQNANQHATEAVDEEDMAVSEAESGVVNTEYTVLESGDLESVDNDNEQVLVYKDLADRNQFIHTEQEGSSHSLLYLDPSGGAYSDNLIVSEGTEALTEEAEESAGLSEETDASQYRLYSIEDTALTVNECAHEMSSDGICQKCGELDLSLLGEADTNGREEATTEKEPVVLKIDVYDRYGDTVIEGDEDLEELDERSELQGNLVLSIEIKVNPDLSTGYYSGKMYLCNVNCDFYTTDAVNMLNHFKQHHGEFEYEYTMYEFKRYMISLSQSFRHTHSDYCPQCGEDKTNAVAFMKCRRFRYLCRSCRFSAKGNHPLVDHLQVHTHQQFHCQLCQCTCIAKLPLADHFRHRHPVQGKLFVGLPPQLTERPPDAVVPWASVRRPKKKRKRTKEHVPKSSPCKCPKCDFAADSHTELMNHLVLTHIKKYTLLRRKPATATKSASATSIVKQFVACNFCEFRAINETMLDRHVAMRHARPNTAV